MATKSPPDNKIFVFSNFVLDTNQKLLFCENQIVPLGQKAYQCLYLFVKNPNRVITKEEFFETIWQDSFVEDGVLTVNISHLRKALQENENQKYIETFVGIGYKFIAEVKTLDNFSTLGDVLIDENLESEKESPKEIPHIPHTLKETQRKSFPKIFILLPLVLLIVSGLSYLLYSRYVTKTVKEETSVVIFPFENLSLDETKDYLGLSIVDNVNYNFSTLPKVKVIPISQTKHLNKQVFDPIEEAKKLSVENVIVGSYIVDKGEIALKLKYINLKQEQPISHFQEYRFPENNLVQITKSVITFILSALDLDKNEQFLNEISKLETEDNLAYEYYLRGVSAGFAGKYNESTNYLQKAVERNSNFQSALYALAYYYQMNGTVGSCGEPCFKKSIEYQTKLIILNPNYREISTLLAGAYFESNKIDEAYQLGVKVIEKNPNHSIGYLISGMALRYAGVLDKSIQHLENGRSKAGKESPANPMILSYLYKGDYETFAQTNHYSSGNTYGLFYRGLTAYYQKKFAEAKKYFDNSYNSNPNFIFAKMAKIFSLKIENMQVEALLMLEELNKQVLNNNIKDGEVIYKIAQLNAIFNQTDKALKFFDKSIDRGFFCYPYFLQDPLMESVKISPQFTQTLNKAKNRHEEFKRKHFSK